MTKRLILMLLFSCSPLWAATYYVDNCVAVGNDRNNGTSTSTPWLTINKVNSSKFIPGDSILFRSGCTWREQLTVPSSGAAGKPITFGAYGNGALPIISGADLLTSWVSAPLFYYAFVATQPNQVFLDGRRLNVAPSKATLATGEWWWDSTNSRVYVRGNPSGHTIEASQRNNAVVAYDVSYVTFKGLHATKTQSHGFWIFESSTYVTCTGCLADWNFVHGFLVSGSGTAHNQLLNSISQNNVTDGAEIGSGADSTTVSGGTFDYNGETGARVDDSTNTVISGITACFNSVYGLKVIGANAPPTNTLFSQNTACSNTSSGIDVDTTQGASGIVLNENSSYSNGENGIMIEVGASGVVASFNLLYGNTDMGIHVSTSSNQVSVYGNVAYNQGNNYDVSESVGTNLYNNTSYGGVVAFRVEESSSNATLTNNLASGQSFLALSVDATSEIDFVSDYNDWNVGASAGLQWGSTAYTFGNWQTVTHRDADSLNAVPLFANALAGQLWLTTGSPCIGSGADLGSPYNMGLLPTSSWPNSVLTVDQDNYGTGWEIGAFVFTGETVQ
jgi:hypothetical protein